MKCATAGSDRRTTSTPAPPSTVTFLSPPTVGTTARHWQCYREGEAANDHNRGVYRRQQGTTKGNPYEVGSDDWKAWRDGYAYRDMVNDG